jgi:hypothetical protein
MSEAKKVGHRVRMAHQALDEMQKAVRLFKLFEPSHPNCARAVDETLACLGRFHEQNGPMLLDVTFDELSLDGSTVLESDEDQPLDIPGLLYPEGVRAIGFDPGIGRDEVEDLIKILAAPYPDEVKDTVFTLDLQTALWNRDFAHIEYKIHDQLSPGSVKNQHDPTLVSVSNRILELVDKMKAKGGQGELDVKAFLGDIAEKRKQGKLEDAATWGSDPGKARLFLVTPAGAERQKLASELTAGGPDLIARASAVVSWSAGQPDDGARPEHVARFLAGATVHALTEGNLPRAAQIMDKVGAIEDPERLVKAAISDRVGSPESLDALARTLEKLSGKSDYAAAAELGKRILAPLDGPAVDSAVGIYPELKTAYVRSIFKGFLETRVAEQPDAIDELTRCSNRAVAEEAAWMLASAGKEGRPFELLEQATRDEQNAVRRSVTTEVYDTVTGEKERKELCRTVADSPDAAKRMEALTALQGRGLNNRTFEAMVAIVEQSRFRDRHPGELATTLGVLVRSGKTRAVRILEVLSRPLPKTLFRGERMDALANLAKEQLRLLGGK